MLSPVADPFCGFLGHRRPDQVRGVGSEARQRASKLCSRESPVDRPSMRLLLKEPGKSVKNYAMSCSLNPEHLSEIRAQLHP